MESSYRRWIQRLTILVREARAEGSAHFVANPRDTAWRLAALAES